MNEKRKIRSGIYLVLDPSMEEELLLQKLRLVLEEELAAVQLWDHFPSKTNTLELIRKITSLCHEKNVPVFINNQWEWLNKADLDGVHFDEIPKNFHQIRQKINKEFQVGLTCNNDLLDVQWAEDHQFDYISFCSIFPSKTSNSCELVKFENIQKARKMTSMPIFLAGGIQPENIPKLTGLPYDGIAIVSGIISSEKPEQAIIEYLNRIKAIK